MPDSCSSPTAFVYVKKPQTFSPKEAILLALMFVDFYFYFIFAFCYSYNSVMVYILHHVLIQIKLINNKKYLYKKDVDFISVISVCMLIKYHSVTDSIFSLSEVEA